MRAVQSGEGKIGRGFLGQSLWGGDYEITFVDTLPDLVARLDDDLDAYEARELYLSNAGHAAPAYASPAISTQWNYRRYKKK